MLPTAGVVLEDPLLHRVALDCEARRCVATADEFAVDLPLTVASLEPEGASDTRRVIGVWEAVEIGAGRNSRRVDAIVRYSRTIDDDLEDLCLPDQRPERLLLDHVRLPAPGGSRGKTSYPHRW